MLTITLELSQMTERSLRVLLRYKQGRNHKAGIHVIGYQRLRLKGAAIVKHS
jgi:hypothetical protein